MTKCGREQDRWHGSGTKKLDSRFCREDKFIVEVEDEDEDKEERTINIRIYALKLSEKFWSIC